MDYVVMIGQLMLSLCILIILHEMGHFLPAKWFKTRAEKFYLFFDPWISLIKAKKLNGSWQVKTALSKDQEFENDDEDVTEYGIGWLPLGGYVKIAGMVDESFDKEQMAKPPQPWEFRSKPAWQRLIIMLGGVTVNFILGFLLFGMVLWVWGDEYLPNKNVAYGIYTDSLGRELGLQDGDVVLSVGDKPFEKFNPKFLSQEIVINGADKITVRRDGAEKQLPVDPKFIGILSSHDGQRQQLFAPRIPTIIGVIAEDAPGYEAGLRQEDQIIALNKVSTPYYNNLKDQLEMHKKEKVEVTVLRNGKDTLNFSTQVNENGQIGFQPYYYDHFFDFEKQEYSAAEAFPLGFQKGWDFLASQVTAFKRMFSGQIKATESLGGFGTFAKIFGTTWEWDHFWQMTAIISLILAFMNLLPIPALDGGHVMFLLYEVVTGRKPSDKFMEVATTAGFILVLALVIFANGLDIMRGCS
ncbi:MAG: RIP metalloprotease RseP [Saprospiraceae bacterium]|nr:RIP metalloprotease RseP [Saprospiraceae bacterium]